MADTTSREHVSHFTDECIVCDGSRVHSSGYNLYISNMYHI